NVADAKKIADQNCELIINHASYKLPKEYLEETVRGNRNQAERVLSRVEFFGAQFLEKQGDASIKDLSDYLRKLSDKEVAEELGLMKEYREAQYLFFLKKY